MESAPRWVPIMDFAVSRGVSLSTLRRYIKTNRIPFKMEGGRYLIPEDAPLTPRHSDHSEAFEFEPRLERIELELMQAQEQILELKMLLAILEEKLGAKSFA